jgi:uncharacterized hydrophobic protein (TIGR00271 family)
MPGVRHVVVGSPTVGGGTELTGDIDTDVTELVLDALGEHRVDPDDVTLSQSTGVRPLAWRRRPGVTGRDTVFWAEVLGRARSHAHPGLIYLLYMVAAGIVAGVGVLTGSAILVVGAMAISPDLLPISATAIGLVERRRPLWMMALLTLMVGLAVVVVAACVATVVLRLSGRVPGNLDLATTVLGVSLTHVGAGTVLVAMAAGMAGMLAYETASSAAVGVGISITTIPAAAYMGAAATLQGYQDAWGGLVLLTTNIVAIVIAGTVTVWLQRRWRRSDPSQPVGRTGPSQSA